MGVRGPRTLRSALTLGFGVTFAVWLLAGLYFAERMALMARTSEATNATYMRSQELLSTIRAQVLLGSVYLRDALLDPQPGTAGEYRARITASYQTADQALRQYQPVTGSVEETEGLRQLRRELDEFHGTVSDIFATDSRHWVTDARLLLRDRVMPHRELIIRMSEDVQALNRSAFVRQQSETAAFYASMERRSWVMLGLALFASLGIGILATGYAGQLERRLQENTRDLQRLSAKIVHVQEEERRVIARDLHDDVGQALSALKVELVLAQKQLQAAGGAEAARALDDVSAIADRALHTTRDLSHLLHPAVLDDLGLSAAVESCVRTFSRRHGVQVELVQDGMDGRLDPATEAAAYRIIQEALTNVATHAQARACRISLRRRLSDLQVVVDDDGRGFEAGAGMVARPGLGLLGIRERVAHMLGTVTLETAPGRGTRLTVELPAPVRERLGPEVGADA